MNREMFFYFRCWFLIDWITQNVKDTSQSFFSNRHGNRSACCCSFHTTYQSIGCAHGDTSYGIIAKMLGYFYNQSAAVFCGNINGFIDVRQLALAELDIQYGTDDLGDLTNILFCHLVSPLFIFHSLLRKFGFFHLPNSYDIALAPAIISVSSWVMEPCLALL